MARLSCEDCQKRLYNLETGEPMTYRAGPDRKECFIDGTEHKPPCKTDTKCPKVSPEEAHKYVLTEENECALELYHAARATGGGCLTDAERTDPITLEWLGTIDSIYRRWETGEQTTSITRLLAQLLTR